ncbi:unnamed protein product, partial [Urochloa humidicola]
PAAGEAQRWVAAVAVAWPGSPVRVRRAPCARPWFRAAGGEAVVARRRGRAAAPASKPTRSTTVPGCCLLRSSRLARLAGLSKKSGGGRARARRRRRVHLLHDARPAPVDLWFVPIRVVPQLAAVATFFDAFKCSATSNYESTTAAKATSSSPPLTTTTTTRTRSADYCPRCDTAVVPPSPPAVDPDRQ